MSKKEENNLQIANYLEGKMSAAEEAAFMLKLSDDAGLRGQYEDEMLLSGLLSKREEDATLLNIFSQADDENTDEIIAPVTRKKRTVFYWLQAYKNIAAALLLLIAATLTYMFLKTDNKQQFKHIAAARKDTSLTIAKSKLSTGNNNQSADSIFKEFYTTYTPGEADPVEVSEYYEAYKKGQYAKVISAAKEDYQVMSTGNENNAATQYMYLYKGLAFLGSNKPDSAIEKFNIIIQANAKKSDLFYTAQWYTALTWLKKNNLAQALTIAKDIQQSVSPYKFKAVQLIQELE